MTIRIKSSVARNRDQRKDSEKDGWIQDLEVRMCAVTLLFRTHVIRCFEIKAKVLRRTVTPRHIKG
jgi:hypothetical protein